ncbi:AhpC-TSA-domain-containing protein [Pleurostoma richardsiae]|uniref:thioredoxin-dependent peroxiredoxin n=1 Tax=Pleurostoma richardsiae TaxID=41990 RepID=A0AA38VZG4_9PEZI|nr:AhpC-TSA-domain-containing protein [Pleurostoma richardsiae]
MPVELRKRKAPAAPPPPPPAKKSKAAKAVAKVKETVKEKTSKATAKEAPAKTNGTPKPAVKPSVGDVITLEGFGGEIETHDGKKTTLKALVDESKAGVVLFTYPKASTPGCTTQACLFRDSYEPLTAGGLAIYGLSTDSPKANTNFKEKQKLPYSLLCDPAATLIGAIGLKKAPKGTTRGVFVVDKAGKVLAAEPGGPAATVEVVKKLVEAADAPVEEKADAEEKLTNGEAAEAAKEEKAEEAVPETKE